MVSGRTLPGSTSLTIVPHNARPRLLVPSCNAVAAGRALLRFSAAISPQQAAARTVLSRAARFGGVRVLPHRIEITGGEDHSIVHYLSQVFGEPVECSLGIGNARANRKPVLEVFSSSGRSVGYAKVATTSVATVHVDAEVSALRELADRALPPEIAVPRLLHVGDWSGFLVSVMTSLRPDPVSTVRLRHRVPRDEMSAFSRAWGSPTRPLPGSVLWADVSARCSALESSPARGRLHDAMEKVEKLSDDRALMMGAWHGDWTPWNMARSDGRVLLWDWERFATGVPAGMDLLHYGVNAAAGGAVRTMKDVHRGLTAVGASTRYDGSAASLVVGAYLTTVATRYREAVDQEGGPLLRGKADVMLDALEYWTGTRS